MAKQSRSYIAILYPDSESYDCDTVLSLLPEVFKEWAYILHDKDTDENGELKKPHYHVVGRLENPALISTVANKLCLPENHLEYCKSFRSSVRYLVHADEVQI